MPKAEPGEPLWRDGFGPQYDPAPDAPSCYDCACVNQSVSKSEGRQIPRGGWRPGAGRKKGSKAKATLKREARVDLSWQRAQRDGELPLDVILRRMRDPGSVSDAAFTAACQAAPYLHPRLSAVAVAQKPKEQHWDLSILNNEEFNLLLKAYHRASKPLAIEGSASDDAL